MATNVTVLGASGSTVTIPFTSAANAAAAQAALNNISKLVQTSLLTQYTYPGTGTVPAPTLLGGVVVSGSNAGDVGTLPGGTYSLVSNATGAVTATSTTTPITVVSGSGGLMFNNLSSNASIFVDGANNAIYEQSATAAAVIGVDDGAYVNTSMGATTINAYANSGVSVQEGGSGTAVVNALGSVTRLVANGNGASAALTVNGATDGSIQYTGLNGAMALINPNSASVYVDGSDSSSSVTLFGGTGSDDVVLGRGFFIGGTGGANVMGTSLVDNATTLVGANTGDVLYSQARDNLLVAGAGAETLYGMQNSSVVGATRFVLGSGDTTVMGDQGGGSYFVLGSGTSNIDSDGFATTHGAANFYAVDAGGGTSTVTGFISGLDQFIASSSAGNPTVTSLNYYTAGQSGSPFGDSSGTELVLSNSTTVDFYNVHVLASDIK